VLGLALIVAACGGGSRAETIPRKAAARSQQTGPVSLPAALVTTLPRGSHVLRTGLQPFSWASAIGGSLYLTQDVTPSADAHTELLDELLRLDPVTGRLLAVRRLGGAFDDALIARGALWLTASTQRRTSLWRLDPRTLAVRSRTRLPGSARVNGSGGSLALAGGFLWVGTGTLDRVSLASGRVDRVRNLHYAGQVQVAADPAGRVLLTSLGSEHPTYIARINAETGALMARTTIPWSVNQPAIEGIVDHGAWLYDSTGMARGIWRIALNTLKTTPTQIRQAPDGGTWTSAQVIDDNLWVSQITGAGDLVYCADLVTGRFRARLALLQGNSTFLAADTTSVYFFNVPLNASSAELERAPIDPRCSS
jgi:hypothetical protein